MQNRLTYASLPSIPVCNCPTLKHSRFAQDRKHAFWLTALCKNSRLVSPQSHLCKFAFHTCLQLPNAEAQQVCPGQETCFLAHCYCAKTADSSLVLDRARCPLAHCCSTLYTSVTTITPVQICLSHRPAAAQHWCTAPLYWTENMSSGSLLLYKHS